MSFWNRALEWVAPRPQPKPLPVVVPIREPSGRRPFY